MFGLSTSQWYGNGEVEDEEIPKTNVQRIIGVDNLELLSCLARVFSQKLSSTFVGNVGINSIDTKSVYQTGQAGRTECLAGV